MAMNFATASKRVRGLLAPTKPADLSKSSLTPDPLRDNIIRDAGAQSERFQSAVRKYPTIEYERTNDDGSTSTESYEWETFPEAVRDFARAAFGWDEPEVLSRDKVRPSHRFNREIMQAAINSPGFRELRPHARNNELESLYGAIMGAPELEAMAPDALERAHRAQREDERPGAARAVRRGDVRAAAPAREAGGPRPRRRAGRHQARDQARAARQGRQAQDALAQLVHEESTSSMVVDAIAAGEAMAQSAAEAVQAMGNVPGSAAARRTTSRPTSRSRSPRSGRRTRTSARSCGCSGGCCTRCASSARRARRTSTSSRWASRPATTCGACCRTSSRAGSARTALIKTSFIKDYAERGLLQYDMEGKAPAGKGPIITVHDGSGSMSGEKFVWATSLCLSVLTIAHREKRQFAGAEFGSAGQVASWIFPPDRAPDPEQVLDYATHFFAGGTSTLTGMREALRIMREHPRVPHRRTCC